jgi:GrpB-like predicted nucleotidyltransferase (UPF0157 family)
MLMNNLKNTIELAPFSPMWNEFYLKECQTLKRILKNNAVDFEHIGATAIPETLAKQTLDILCVVHTLDGIQLFKSEFQNLGFTLKEASSDKLVFIRLAKDGVTQLSNIYILEKTDSQIDDFLDFRDYLIQEDEVAREYGTLNTKLKDQDYGIYTAGKNEFIKTVLKNLK